MGVCRGGGSVLVNNCLVNCTFIGEKANAVGGICGWKDGAASSLTVKNTIILSQYTTAPEPTTYMSDYISRNGCTIDNVYYAERSKIEGATERGTLASGTQLASGEITYKLNGGTSEGDLAWFQTIGTDETPRLFGGDVVYFIDGQYMNKVAGVSGDANGDGKVDAGDVQTVLIGIANGNEDPAYDANGDGKVDAGDVQTILITIANQ